MKIHIAYDQHGRILAAAAQDGDRPAAGPGVTVAELAVPKEFEKLEPHKFFHRLRVDVAKKELLKIS